MKKICRNIWDNFVFSTGVLDESQSCFECVGLIDPVTTGYILFDDFQLSE